MKVVILAGGLGTRLAEETDAKPKPMVEIGGRPILWHIMKHYARHGLREFYVALGYKAEVIKRFFLDYHALQGDLTVRLADGAVSVHDRAGDDWTVHLVDTGIDTNTGGRLKRLEAALGGGPFMLTYGDAVSDIDLPGLARQHRESARLATITAVRPPARFGGLVLEGDRVQRFEEKPQVGEGWINGGFMVFEPGIFGYLANDSTSLEINALERLAADGRLTVWRHEGFWQCMDTLREVRLLQHLWESGKAPWRTWR